MQTWIKFKKYLSLMEEKLLIILSMISLTLTYLIGIGVTSLVAKLVKKKFFTYLQEKSQWVIVNYQDKVNGKMY